MERSVSSLTGTARDRRVGGAAVVVVVVVGGGNHLISEYIRGGSRKDRGAFVRSWDVGPNTRFFSHANRFNPVLV